MLCRSMNNARLLGAMSLIATQSSRVHPYCNTTPESGSKSIQLLSPSNALDAQDVAPVIQALSHVSIQKNAIPETIRANGRALLPEMY